MFHSNISNHEQLKIRNRKTPGQLRWHSKGLYFTSIYRTMNNLKFETIYIYPGQIVTAATRCGIKRVLTVTLDDISRPKHENCRECALKLTELCKVINCGENHLIPIYLWQTSK